MRERKSACERLMRKKAHMRKSECEGMGRGGHKKGRHKGGIKHISM